MVEESVSNNFSFLFFSSSLFPHVPAGKPLLPLQHVSYMSEMKTHATLKRRAPQCSPNSRVSRPFFPPSFFIPLSFRSLFPMAATSSPAPVYKVYSGQYKSNGPVLCGPKASMPLKKTGRGRRRKKNRSIPLSLW